jgi:hypothetical protein
VGDEMDGVCNANGEMKMWGKRSLEGTRHRL